MGYLKYIRMVLALTLALGLCIPQARAIGGSTGGTGGGTGESVDGTLQLYDFAQPDGADLRGLQPYNLVAQSMFSQIMRPQLVQLANFLPYVGERIARELTNLKWYTTDLQVGSGAINCFVDNDGHSTMRAVGKRVAISKAWLDKLSESEQSTRLLEQTILLMNLPGASCDAFTNIEKLFSGSDTERLDAAAKLGFEPADLIQRAEIDSAYVKVKGILNSSCSNDQGIVDFTGLFNGSFCRLKPAPCGSELMNFVAQENPSLDSQITWSMYSINDTLRAKAGKYCPELVRLIEDQYYGQNSLSFDPALSGE